MSSMTFKAYAITNEIDLNKLALDCGIPKKYTWEEPLVMQNEILAKILGKKAAPDQKVLVFSFGSIVFINHAGPSEVTSFLKYMKSFEPEISLAEFDRYTDDYRLHIGDTETLQLTDEYVIVPQDELFYPELISTVLAKSVALEKTEEQLGKILDRTETMIDRLEKANLRISDKELAKTTARIVRHEYNTIAYIMILDKPDITWTNSEAGEFYHQMAEFFELTDRYEILKSKTAILYNIMEGFSTISHSTRGIFVEWVIVLLIVAEVVLMIIEAVR